MAKIVAGLFDRFLNAGKAVEDLLQAGFEKHALSIVAKDASGEYAGRAGAESGGLLAGVGSGPGAGLSMGPLVASLGEAGVGGGLEAVLTGSKIPEEDARSYAEGVRRGGALVLVRTDDAHAGEAQRVMDEAGAVDIGERAAEWRSQGWAPGVAEEAELAHSSDPAVRQIALSGSRIYSDGLEMNPRSSSFAEFESHFQSQFGDRGYTYRQFAPAYQYGRALASREPYRGKDWSSVEPSAQREWEDHNPNTWEQVRQAIQYGFSGSRRDGSRQGERDQRI